MTPNEIAETFFIITKRIIKGILKWLLILAAVIFVISLVIAGYNKIDQYFEGKNAEKLSAAQAKERACIGGDIARMEEAVKELSSKIESDDTIDQVAKKFAGSSKDIQPADDDITQKVLVYSVPTNCSSPFSLLINIRADQKGNLLWFRVWSQNPPPELGYPQSLVEKFTVDFDSIRKEKIYQDVQRRAAAEENARRSAAKQQQEELQKKKLEIEAWNLQHLNSNQSKNTVSNYRAELDPCAPALSKQERLRRLALLGPVKQNSENSYSTAGHWLSFDFLGSLTSCN